MNKRYILVLIIVIVAAAGIILATIFTRTDSSTVKQLTLKFSELQANYPVDPDTCLAVSNNADLNIEDNDRVEIENANASTIIDVPAGTNVDVYVKTYDGSTATGTSIYESTFGSYNFTAQKTTGSNPQWVVSSFVACKK